MTEEQMRAEWRAAGGRMYGPNVKTVAMPEAQYFEFRRSLPQSDVEAWMDPKTLDVIHADKKRAWETEYGAGGKQKASTYTVPMVRASDKCLTCSGRGVLSNHASDGSWDDRPCPDCKMGKHARLYYEAHITIDPVPEDQRPKVQGLLAPYNFKLAKLLMQKGEPSAIDTFATGHGKELQDIKTRLLEAVYTLHANGHTVRRWKIEDTLFDSRHGDTFRSMM